MNLTTNYLGRTNEIQKELERSFFLDKVISLIKAIPIPSIAIGRVHLIKWLVKKEKQVVLKQIQKFEHYSLTLEGLQGHIDELDIDTATKLLAEFKKVTQRFDNLDERVARSNYFQDASLKQSFKYFLRTLYKTEAKLHKVISRNNSVEPTPNYIKEGLNSISQEAISKSLQ